MGELYLMRHARSESNEFHVFGENRHLSEEGRLQAAGVRQELLQKGLIPKVTFVSNKLRSAETAAIALTESIMKVNPLFNEIYFGDLEGKDIEEDIEKEISNDWSILKVKYGGDDIVKRAKQAINALNEIELEYDGIVFVVLHGTLLEAIQILYKYGREEKNKLWTGEYYIKNCNYLKWSEFKKLRQTGK